MTNVAGQIFEAMAGRIDDRLCQRHGKYNDLPLSFGTEWAGFDDAQRSREIAEYVYGAKVALRSGVQQHGMVSGTCDESAIKGLCISAGVLATPHNTAVIFPPQAFGNYRVV